MSTVSLASKTFSTVFKGLSLKFENLAWKKKLQQAGVNKADEIFTYTTLHELRALYTLAKNCPHNSFALEIGSHLGASSCYIAAGLSKVSGHLLCVDTWNNETMPEGQQDTFLKFEENTAGVNKWLIPIRKRSDQLKKEDIKHPLSLVFIDGDHSYEAVKKDFEIIQQWLDKDAIVAFHDFSAPKFEGVTRVVGEALASGEWMMVEKENSLVWIQRARWISE